MRISDWSSDVCSSDLQSNYEGQIVEWIHEAIDEGAGIIINPAALTFTSIAILDALKMFPGPIIELHISNIHRREAYYHNSFVSKVATAVIAGLGPGGSALAVQAMAGDRKSGVSGKGGAVRVDPGGRGIVKKKKSNKT